MAKMDPGGWWCFEFEADVTIPAEYIMLLHFLGKPEPALEERICVYIRRIQSEDGSWPLYPEGEGNLSCTVKAYYALKLAGADVNDSALVKARNFIRAHGGAEKVNMFTRIALGAVWPDSLSRVALHAGRGHPAAAVVPVQHV